MKNLIKYFWKTYYYFKPVKKDLGKTNMLKEFARINGLQIVNLKMSKIEKTDVI